MAQYKVFPVATQAYLGESGDAFDPGRVGPLSVSFNGEYVILQQPGASLRFLIPSQFLRADGQPWGSTPSEAVSNYLTGLAGGNSVSQAALTAALAGKLTVATPEQYGAVGDGTTDDTAAINNAISALSASGKPGRLAFGVDKTYLTDGVLVKANVWLDLGKATLKKRGDGGTPQTNSLIRAVPVQATGSYYGTYKNIRITGGTLDQNGKVSSANLVNLWFCENLSIENVTVASYSATWAFSPGGRNVSIRDCTVLGGSALFEDGIHFVHGRNLSAVNCYVESGDDAIALGTDPVTYLTDENDGIDGVTITNCRVKSNRAYGVSLYTPTDASANYFIRNVAVTGVTGSAGALRNGAIQINDKSSPALGSGRIYDVSIVGFALSAGSASHDDTAPLAVNISGAQRVKISTGSLSVTNGSGASSGFRVVSVINSSDVSLDTITCAALTTREALYISGSQNVIIAGNDKSSGTPVVGIITAESMNAGGTANTSGAGTGNAAASKMLLPIARCRQYGHHPGKPGRRSHTGRRNPKMEVWQRQRRPHHRPVPEWLGRGVEEHDLRQHEDFRQRRRDHQGQRRF